MTVRIKRNQPEASSMKASLVSRLTLWTSTFLQPVTINDNCQRISIESEPSLYYVQPTMTTEKEQSEQKEVKSLKKYKLKIEIRFSCFQFTHTLL